MKRFLWEKNEIKYLNELVNIQMSCYHGYYPTNAFVLGDVRCKYIPVRRKFSAELVISPPDKIFVYTAMYVGPIRPSVTGPS